MLPLQGSSIALTTTVTLTEGRTQVSKDVDNDIEWTAVVFYYTQLTAFCLLIESREPVQSSVCFYLTRCHSVALQIIKAINMSYSITLCFITITFEMLFTQNTKRHLALPTYVKKGNKNAGRKPHFKDVSLCIYTRNAKFIHFCITTCRFQRLENDILWWFGRNLHHHKLLGRWHLPGWEESGQ